MKIKDEKVSELIEKLAEKKARIEHKEKLIREKERKKKVRRFIEIGNIASRFGMDALDDPALIGAFAEMEERSKNPAIMDEWKKRSETLSKGSHLPLMISFGKELTDDMKKFLKENRFRWNTFRKEWHGYGIKQEIEELVKSCHGKVEVARG